MNFKFIYITIVISICAILGGIAGFMLFLNLAMASPAYFDFGESIVNMFLSFLCGSLLGALPISFYLIKKQRKNRRNKPE